MPGPTLRTPIHQRLRRLARCQRGAVMPLFLVSAAVIFGASLGGLDLARHAGAKTQLQSALDGAALAMGRLASSQQDAAVLLGEARRYFEANFRTKYQGTGIDASKLSLTMNDNGRVLTLSVEGSLPLLSTGFLEVSAAALRAQSTVTLQGNPNLEVVFAKDTNSFDGLGELFFSSELRNLGKALLANQDNSVYIGTVPYTDVVNVGQGKRQQGWVERWLEHDTANKARSGAKNYHLSRWSGCIAEPGPWEKPDLGGIDPLTPNARFIPLFARVQTSLNDGNNPGKGWTLRDKTWSGDERITQYVEQPISLSAVATGADRYFWSDFVPGSGNSPKSQFDIFSLHEPVNCDAAAEVHFLDNTEAAIDALDTMANIRPAEFGKSLPPVGLLWSWRMLTESWREENGWNAANLPKSQQTPARAIVLITPGDMTSWDWLGFTERYNTLRPIWSMSADNYFHFRMRYHSDTCKGGDHNGNGGGKGNNNKGDCHNGERHVREYVHNSPLSSTRNEWQYPVSSLAMANPFASEDTLNFTGWPSVGDYLEATCSAIKEDGISLFVLSPRLVDWPVANKQRFLRCSSDSKVHTLGQMETLEQALLNLRSESSTLRLVPSS